MRILFDHATHTPKSASGFLAAEEVMMMRASYCYLFLAVLLFIEPATARLGGGSDVKPASELERKLAETGSRIHVIIGYKSKQAPDLSSILAHPIRSGPGLTKVRAVKAFISKEELQALQNDPSVRYVEENAVVVPFGSTYDDYPYGIRMSQADTPDSPWPPRTFTNSAACSDESSFKVAIIDSGLEAAHPDIPCLPIDDDMTNCIGKEFGLGDEDKWYDPAVSHGTHVAGTIGALRNQLGLGGMLSDSSNVCFIIGQVCKIIAAEPYPSQSSLNLSIKSFCP